MTLRYEDMNKNERFAATMGNLLRMTLGVAKDRIVKVDKLILLSGKTLLNKII